MDQQQIIANLEHRASAIGTTMSQICDRAGVHRTTFSRWKRSDRNPEPIGATLDTLGKLGAALDAAEAEVAADHAVTNKGVPGSPSGRKPAESTPPDEAPDRRPVGAPA